MYAALTTTSGAFRAGAAEKLKDSSTNQLWRNTLLALQVRKNGYVAGHVVVVACKDDRTAEAAVRGMSEQLLAPDDVLRHVALEDLVEHAGQHPPLADWAGSFRRRYLDLSPVLAAL